MRGGWHPLISPETHPETHFYSTSPPPFSFSSHPHLTLYNDTYLEYIIKSSRGIIRAWVARSSMNQVGGAIAENKLPNDRLSLKSQGNTIVNVLSSLQCVSRRGLGRRGKGTLWLSDRTSSVTAIAIPTSIRSQMPQSIIFILWKS